MAAMLTRIRHCFLVLIVAFINSGGCNNISCSQFSKFYDVQGLRAKVPDTGIPGVNLHFCPTSISCCSQEMENSLKSLSQKQFQQSIQKTLSLVKGTFSSGTSKFDDFFSVLLDNSQRGLHQMFVQTYGLLYQENTHIFKELFTDLKAYYKGKRLDLSNALHDFFVRLLKRMFELLNRDTTFTPNYLNCVVRHMNDLKPFGDVPINLSKQVKRAFVAARTFVQGLAIGRDVILAISDIPPTKECLAGLMKMLHCPRCRGLIDTKPCSNFCLNTMKGCLAHQQELNAAWNEYISALIRLAERLEGPFNIESVVDPIDVKISDAIMNFQNNGQKVSQRIFQGCGDPTIGKRKKRAAQGKSDIEDLAFGTDWKSKDTRQAKPTTALGTSLDRLVRAIKSKIQLSKDYWNQLPYSICNNEAMSAKIEDDSNCWNGQDKGKYMPNMQKDGVVNQGDNPEVKVEQEGNSVVILQIDKLKIITTKLQSAYSGYDVDYIVDVDVESSGSGSGSGVETTSDTEDAVVISGSGDGGWGSGYDPDDDSDHERHDKRRRQKVKNGGRGEGGRGHGEGGRGGDGENPRENTHTKSNYYFMPSTTIDHGHDGASTAAIPVGLVAVVAALVAWVM